MTITITVNAKGVTWSRTASIEVDTAQYQQGDAVQAILFGSEAVRTTGLGMHSYDAIAVLFVANKAKGSIGIATIANSGSASIRPLVTTYLPLIVYNGAGTGFTGAFNTSGKGTDTPTGDNIGLAIAVVMGASQTQAIAGLKATS